MFKKEITTFTKTIKFIKLELIIVWGIVSFLAITTVIAPFFLDKQTILENTPICFSKSQLNIECISCGITRAFIEISNGNLMSAHKLNKSSLIIYSCFTLNFCVFILYMMYHNNRRNYMK